MLPCMSCHDCFYGMLLQVFANVYVSLNIHVLTGLNVPISMGHMTTQNRCYFDVLLLTTYDYSLLIPV